jgi:N-alpha-acetyltransferase 15/16, NatA auxiliary subunit
MNIYKNFSEKYARSDVPRKLPLEFLSGEMFKQSIDKYLQRSLHKGVPPLFKGLKHLLKDEEKLKTIEQLMLGYVENLTKSGHFSDQQVATSNESNVEIEPPTSLLWTYYYLAQHYDYLRQIDEALNFINKAIEHTPTLVELYMCKGKIFKHAGNLYEAVKWMDEAQSLDTADRFVNYKCSKYMLRANMIKEAQEIASKFTRVYIKHS